MPKKTAKKATKRPAKKAAKKKATKAAKKAPKRAGAKKTTKKAAKKKPKLSAVDVLLAESIADELTKDESKEIVTLLKKRAAGHTLTAYQQTKLDNFRIARDKDEPPTDLDGELLPLTFDTMKEAQEALGIPIRSLQAMRRSKHPAIAGQRIFSGLLWKEMQENPEGFDDVPKQRGRPTKLTPALCKAICEDIARGNYAYTAALLNGVSESAYYQWKEKGLTQERGIYRQFMEAVAQAEAIRESELTKDIKAHAPTDWRAAAFLLENTSRKHFGKHQTIEATGKDGEPLPGLAPPVVNIVMEKPEDGKLPWIDKTEKKKGEPS